MSSFICDLVSLFHRHLWLCFNGRAMFETFKSCLRLLLSPSALWKRGLSPAWLCQCVRLKTVRRVRAISVWDWKTVSITSVTWKSQTIWVLVVVVLGGRKLELGRVWLRRVTGSFHRLGEERWVRVRPSDWDGEESEIGLLVCKITGRNSQGCVDLCGRSSVWETGNSQIIRPSDMWGLHPALQGRTVKQQKKQDPFHQQHIDA